MFLTEVYASFEMCKKINRCFWREKKKEENETFSFKMSERYVK